MYDEKRKENDEYEVKTTISQHNPQNLIDKIVSYIIHIRRNQKQHGYKAENNIAMDETAVWTAWCE